MKLTVRYATPPPLDATTIEWLDETYPERSPDPADSEREVWMKAGERRLVRHLRNLLTKQENTPRVHV